MKSLLRASGRRGQIDFLSDQHIAATELPDYPEPLLLEHLDRPKPGGDCFPVGGRIGFDNPAAMSMNRRQCRMKCKAGDSQPTVGPVYEEAGDPPAGGLAQTAGNLLVFPPAFDPRQILAATELTPSYGLTLSVDQDPLGMPLLKQRAVVSAVRLLSNRAAQWTGRTFAVIEHAPAPRLNPMVLLE